MPALFTRMVIDPRTASVSVTRPATSAERVTSATAEKTRTPVLPSASAEFASATRSRPQMATEAPSEARRCAMARPMPRLAPVTRATPPERGFRRGYSVFVVFIPAIRILPPPGHSFCAKLILSSAFFAALGTPEAAKGIGGIPPPAQKTIFRSTRQCTITACGCRAAFPIIPTFSETMRFPVEAFRGAPEEENPGTELERGEMGMNGIRKVTGLAMVVGLCLILGNGLAAYAQAPAAGQDATAPKYTMAEYNAYQACAAEKAPATLLKCLDDFVSKYPNSTLLNYIYPLYYQAYSAQKNYARMMESADKLAALGGVDALTRFNAYYSHVAAYSAMITDPAQKTAAADPVLAKAAEDAAAAALKTLADVKKPDNAAEDAWAKQLTQFKVFLNGVAAQAATVAKDCKSAVEDYKAVLALNPDDAISSYRLGLAYLCLNPPQQMDAFWSIARAVTAKSATQAQSAKVKDYLRKLIANYQGGTVCESLIDAELNELLQLASSSVERPESYKIPSAADLTAAQKDMTIASVIADLKAGGDKGKLTWLAACGLEFPEVPGKVIQVVPGTDFIVLKIAFVTSDEEFEKATTANMDVKVVGQPEAARVEKDSAVHFTGTLTSYDPEPAFFLHWDKAKVKEEDIPKEKGAPKKPVRKPAARKPA